MKVEEEIFSVYNAQLPDSVFVYLIVIQRSSFTILNVK